MFLEAKEKAGRLRVDVMVEVSIRPIGQGLQEDSQNWNQSILWGFLGEAILSFRTRETEGEHIYFGLCH